MSEANTSSGVLASYKYDAFGVDLQTPIDTIDNVYSYTGRERDDSGLYYYRARYYLPEVGRFLTADPMGIAQGSNAYVYVGSNPVNYKDPFGLFGTSTLTNLASPISFSGLSSETGSSLLNTGLGLPGGLGTFDNNYDYSLGSSHGLLPPAPAPVSLLNNSATWLAAPFAGHAALSAAPAAWTAGSTAIASFVENAPLYYNQALMVAAPILPVAGRMYLDGRLAVGRTLTSGLTAGQQLLTTGANALAQTPALANQLALHGMAATETFVARYPMLRGFVDGGKAAMLDVQLPAARTRLEWGAQNLGLIVGGLANPVSEVLGD